MSNRKIDDNELTEVTGGTGIQELNDGGIAGVPVEDSSRSNPGIRPGDGGGNIPLDTDGGGSGNSNMG